MDTLALEYLARYQNPMQAYVELQRALMRRFITLGGTASEFVERLASAFRKRFGWMMHVTTPTPSRALVRMDVRNRAA